MARTARERLARLLGESEPAGSFAAELHVPAHALHLEVSGVGPVRLPVRAPLARKLIAVARPAMFGRGERTLSDTAVRDTWELTPDQLTLGGPGWTALMNHALQHFRDELGLPPTAHLRVEPHAMLVYGKEQFFLPHQDSETDDTMVGTLVVSLPSAHTGGELVVEHAGQSLTYRASKEKLTFVAFYADCRHQVTPVRSGYRVTLTFHLLATPATATPQAGPATEPARCLTEHFATPVTRRYGTGDLDPPNRLVVLLDHEYTQRGLDRRRLKGVDMERAELLRAAAEQAGCETVLALAEVKQTWDAVASGSDPWDDDPHSYDDEGDPGDLELNELIDDEIVLDWWTGPDGTGGEPISLPVGDHEVCAPTASVHLTPYRSEYEGYMGNYGNTLDRWYRRAAVVVWPRERAFTARAEAGSPWALHELRHRIEAGDLDGARAAAESLTPFWKRTATGPELLGAALDVAAGLDAAGPAALRLEPVRGETHTHHHAGGLAPVAGRDGEGWTRRVVDGWFGPTTAAGADLSGWIDTTLPGLCGTLRTSGRPEVARLLAAGAWRWLEDLLGAWMTVAQNEVRRRELELLSAPLVGLLGVADDDLRAEITGALRGCADTVLECLMPALRRSDARPAAGLDTAGLDTAGLDTAGLDTVARDCAQRLRTIIARPSRAEDDWSITWTGCGCDLCDTLATFLGSRSQRVLDWPLATDGRRHVHSRIDSAGLPVQHRTRRQGRPYTLTLTKTDELFTRATNARLQAMADLTWLTSERGPAPTRT